MTDITYFNQAANTLLVEVTVKLIALRQQPLWQAELPSRCPPILWFGDAQSQKPKLLTLAANPSRQEYLRDSSKDAFYKVQQTNDDSLLSYLEPPSNRFRLLAGNEKLENILTQQELRTEIIASYNNYFERNPYRWFGLRKAEAYNVEGFLRGLDASFYHGQQAQFTGVHIDLFPFATVRDFGTIQQAADRDLFASGWAKRLIIALVELLQPEAIVVFGRTNFFYFANYVDQALHQAVWQRYNGASFTIGTTKAFDIPVIGLSTNLGNPKGFDWESLRRFGRFVAEKANLSSL